MYTELSFSSNIKKHKIIIINELSQKNCSIYLVSPNLNPFLSYIANQLIANDEERQWKAAKEDFLAAG